MRTCLATLRENSTCTNSWEEFTFVVNKIKTTVIALYAPRAHDEVNYSLLALKRTLSHRTDHLSLLTAALQILTSENWKWKSKIFCKHIGLHVGDLFPKATVNLIHNNQAITVQLYWCNCCISNCLISNSVFVRLKRITDTNFLNVGL
jgi:hypothetical protein